MHLSVIFSRTKRKNYSTSNSHTNTVIPDVFATIQNGGRNSDKAYKSLTFRVLLWQVCFLEIFLFCRIWEEVLCIFLSAVVDFWLNVLCDLWDINTSGTSGSSKWVKGVSFWRNCGAASVGEWNTKIWFINGVDNVNWPPYRDWKAKLLAFQSLYGGQFTLSTPLINQIFW